MVYFQTKNPNLGNFWSALDWNMLVYFTAVWSIFRIHIWYTVWRFGTFCVHLVHFSSFGIMQQEKSGNPAK
jgi:hypothetical protein